MTDITTIIILFVVGAIFVFVNSKLIEKRKRIIANATETDGIIFSFETSFSNATNSKTNYPVIRFVTKDGVWITETSDYSTIPFLLKQGQKVTVTYNSENPKEFIFTASNFDFSKLRLLFLAVGVICITISVWLVYKYLTGHN